MTMRNWLTLLAAGLALAACSRSAGEVNPGGPDRQARSQRPVTARHLTGLSAVRAGLRGQAGDPPYYLSLGDSLAQGIQPGPTGADEPTSAGYPDQLASMLRTALPGLRLVKLGCSGETTLSMIHGGICHYPAGSQLAQADEFLRSHAGRVALVTIDIGGNDPNSCVLGQPTGLNILGCLNGRVKQTRRNVSTILSSLRSAAGSKVLIVGMTYYVPELGLWRTSPMGQEAAVLTEGFVASGNKLLAAQYHHYGARVADVFGAFDSADFSLAKKHHFGPAKSDPPNVTAVCALTWMCAPAPRGPNEHANNAGYHVIAQAFWHAITT